MSLCTEWTLSKSQPDRRFLKVLTCRSWSHPPCAVKRRRQLIQQAASGEPNRLLTLTVNPHSARTVEERHDLLVHAWQVVVKRLRRMPQYRNIEYFLVKEATKAGEPHLHVLLRSGFIPQSLISAWMRELTGSYIVDIRKIRGAREAAAYVAKYIAKEPARFGASKRYIASQGYELDKRAKLAELPGSAYRWVVEKSSISVIIWGLAANGWIELDGTGDVFEFLPPVRPPPLISGPKETQLVLR